MMQHQPRVFTLPNGIRVVHLYCRSRVACCGLTINTGTRDELPDEHGIAHFLEHMLFKGTKNRKAYHINNRLESLGGELNAFTTKEETVIHATTLKRDAEKAVELIADIVFNSVFPQKELDKEKIVICDEIDSYKDSPAELIFDDFEDLLFQGSSLGRNTLGTKRKIKSITQQDIIGFMDRTYNTDQMILTIVGQIPENKVEQWCTRYLTGLAANQRHFERNSVLPYAAFDKQVNKATHQAHCIIGNRAYQYNDVRFLTLSLLVNLLSGPMSNSILNTVLREQHGLVYSIEANYSAYVDTGMVNIYFGTAKQNLDQSRELVVKELKKISQQALGSSKMQRIKKQFIGQLIIASESMEQQMLGLGKSMLAFNRCERLDDTIARIETIEAADILDVANDIFNPQRLSVLSYL